MRVDHSASYNQLFITLLQGLFPVDPDRKSITGHSMGGHGAMVAHLKNRG